MTTQTDISRRDAEALSLYGMKENEIGTKLLEAAIQIQARTLLDWKNLTLSASAPLRDNCPLKTATNQAS